MAALATTVAVGADGGAKAIPSSTGSAAEWQTYLEANCLACHSSRMKAGDLVLERTALEPVGTQAEVWEKVIRKLEAGEMPPPSVRRRPDAHQTAAFVAWLTRTLDEHAAAQPDAGRPAIRRLTRVEYSNAVRDLLAIDVDPSAQLPPDAIVGGFNNNGDVLSLSPLLMEKYMQSARRVTRLAFGDPSLPRANYSFKPPERQDLWREGLPFGVRGLPDTEHYFPQSGEYSIRVFTDLYSLGRLPEVEGQRFFQHRVFVEAGSHRISAVVPQENAFAQGPIPDIPGWAGAMGGPLDPLRTATRLPLLDLRLDGKRIARFEIKPPTGGELGTPGTVTPGSPWIRRMEIDGPYNATGTGSTPSRARLLTCAPKSAREEGPCAQRALAAFTRRAFRREVSSRDVAPFMAIYADARRETTFEGAVRQAMEAVLVSPDFLLRVEHEPARAKPGQNYTLDNYDLATRLSFFLWSSIPDDRLLDLAKAGRLRDERVLEREARRMLADPRASALVDNFGMQFLGLQDIQAFVPDKAKYPDFNTTLREDMEEEAKLLVRNIFLNDRSVTELLSADYSYLNERLAAHYGVPGVSGSRFRRVTFAPDEPRGGVLGLGAVLMTTSHTFATSPVLRGKWVLASLLNQPPSPPPPGVPALEPNAPSGRVLTGREQMEQHRTNPVCSSCHARMDPFGFALENFDVTGRWRVKDEGGPVNPDVSLPDGAAFSGPLGLKQRLVSRQDDFARSMTERLMTYALGRSLAGADGPTVRKIVSEAKADDYRFQSLVIELVKSAPFRMRKKGPDNVL